MKSFNILFLIFLAVMLILPVLFLMKIPPREITFNDLASSAPVQSVPKSNSFQGSYKKAGTDLTSMNVEYYVIVGSFTDPVKAGQRAGELRNKTKSDIIILEPSSDGYTRISLGKYESREDAESVRDNVKQNIDPKAWILTVEK